MPQFAAYTAGMILYYTEKSPFARKVRMAVYHHGLNDEVELKFAMPTDRTPELMAQNPLGKIPVLVTDEGASIVDSPVICQYLDGIGHGPLLVPSGHKNRIAVLHLEALADGIMESAVLMMLEYWRPKENQWPGQFDKQTDNIIRTLAELEKKAEALQQPLSIAHLAVACAIDYIHHRLPAIAIKQDWLANHPKLADWYAQFKGEPIMQETSPKEGWA